VISKRLAHPRGSFGQGEKGAVPREDRACGGQVQGYE